MRADASAGFLEVPALSISLLGHPLLERDEKWTAALLVAVDFNSPFGLN